MYTHTSILLLAASTTITASAILHPRQSGPTFLGRPCTPGGATCLGGAQCYAVNSMLVPTCGNQGAECTSDAQCATNTCVNGECNGPVAPVLPLGTACYESAQCENNAACYAVNAMQIPSCGNFQAQCTGDAQCAFNACVDGFCNGAPLASSSASVAPTTSVSPTSASPTSASPTAPTSTTSPSATSSSVPTSSPSSSAIVPPTSSPTAGSTTTITTFTTTTSCPSMSTTIPPPTGTGHSSVIGNSTAPTTASPSPTLFQGAGEQLRAGIGSIVVAVALGFALMIGA